MASYYYLISSLPEINSSSAMPITYEQFLTMVEGNVSKSRFELLKNLSLSSTEGPLVKEWSQVYGNLMKEINYQRSMKLGKSYPNDYDKDPETAKVASEALSAFNPMAAEKILLDYQFEVLDQLVGIHAFDDAILFGYALKLKLLERQSCFIDTKGKAEFKKLFDQVQERVYSI